MGNNWTDEQRLAIEARGSNLLVSAAAGSGKTAVLVERIIQMITKDKVDIDTLLVVTFTNAAAAEMRERIGEAIVEALDENPSDRNLERQLSLLNRSSITTIHSFCLEIIRNNFHHIGLDPGFRISDDTEGAILREEALEEALEESYEAKDPDFLSLVDAYGGKKDDKYLAELVLGLYHFIMSSPWPLKWLREKVEYFNLKDKSLMDLPVLKNLMQDILFSLKSFEVPLENALETARSDAYIKGYEEAILQSIDLYLALQEILKDGNSFDEVKSFLDNVKFDALKRAKKGYDPALADEVKNARNDFKDFISGLKGYFGESEADNRRIIEKTYPVLVALENLTKRFMDKYEEKKREKGLLDFSDLEHLALKILTVDENGEVRPSDIAKEYKNKYAEVLVDEYQDSNEVQEVIISMVSRKNEDNPNVFMVGDVKQSIYRFRQAKPELFMDKYRTYSLEGNGSGRKILLYKNFRSRRNILDSVNFLFKGIMSERVGELDYTDEEALIYGATYYEMNELEDQVEEATEELSKNEIIEVMLVEESGSPEEGEDSGEGEDQEIDPSEYKAIEVEAKMVSEKINELIRTGFPVYDKNTKTMRPVTYRDIVILMRATSRTATIFLEELHEANIPSYSDSSTGYFDTIEIRTMMSLLKIIDNPLQDVPLVAALRSPLFSFSEEDLVEIRKVSDKEFLYNNMVAGEDFSEDVREKIHSFLEKLGTYRSISRYMNLDEFIWYLYTDTSYLDYVGAMPDGIERQANLKILFQRAKQFEETTLKGLFNFIRFIDKLKKTTGDIGAAKILGENENLVRIMSIHKSKGLEFPVVFLVNASKRFNKMDLNRQIILHETLGFGPNFVDLERGVTDTTLIKEVIRRKISLENISEEMRVLYVALTRAKEKLIITGHIKDAEKSMKKWTELSAGEDFRILEGKVEKASGYLDWIMSVLLKHWDFCAQRTDGKSYVFGKNVGFNLEIRRKAAILQDLNLEEEKPAGLFTLDTIRDADSAFEINQRLGFRYAFEEETKKSSKISVTELKRLAGHRETDDISETLLEEKSLERPKFMMKKAGLTAAEKGTAFHKVMQYMDFGHKTREEIEKDMENMVSKELIRQEEADAVDPAKVWKLLTSPLGQRMERADAKGDLRREAKFLMNMDDSEVMVIGVIDCYFMEEGQLVLVDYKTDYVTGEDYEVVLANRYKEQLRYYKDALESITGCRTKDVFLYSVSSGQEISII